MEDSAHIIIGVLPLIIGILYLVSDENGGK